MDCMSTIESFHILIFSFAKNRKYKHKYILKYK